MTRTIAPTERCSCGQPVTVTRWTERSRHNGKPLCERHAVMPPVHFEARDVVAAPMNRQCASCGKIRPVADLHHIAERRFCAACVTAGKHVQMRSLPGMALEDCARCHEPLLVTVLTARSIRTDAPICHRCADGGFRTEVRYAQVDTSSSWAYVDAQLEHRRNLTDEQRAELAGYEARRNGYDEDDEYRGVDLDDDGYEIRSWGPDGVPSYEDDGEYFEGRSYAGRFWVEGWEERANRGREEWIGASDWELR
jgi:hypothetical protein